MFTEIRNKELYEKYKQMQEEEGVNFYTYYADKELESKKQKLINIIEEDYKKYFPDNLRYYRETFETYPDDATRLTEEILNELKRICDDCEVFDAVNCEETRVSELTAEPNKFIVIVDYHT